MILHLTILHVHDAISTKLSKATNLPLFEILLLLFCLGQAFEYIFHPCAAFHLVFSGFCWLRFQYVTIRLLNQDITENNHFRLF